jgi:hypothetical protein
MTTALKPTEPWDVEWAAEHAAKAEGWSVTNEV